MFGIIRRVFDNIDALRAELAAERACRFHVEQRIAELKAEHAKEREESRRRLAISQANFEWLSIAFNKSEAERSQLMLGRLGIVTPPLRVETTADGLPGATLDEQRDRRDVDRGVRDTADLNDLLGNVGTFDDVGENAARALGLKSGEIYDPDNILARL